MLNNTKALSFIEQKFSQLVVLSISILAAFRLPEYGYGSDSANMLEQIHVLVDTGKYTNTHFPPGFGILAYPFYLLTGSIPFSGVLLSYIAFLSILLVVYKISKLASLSSFEAWFVTAVVALNPGIFSQVNNGMSEVVYSALLMSLAYFIFKYSSSEKWFFSSIIIGFILSYAYLIRAEVLIVYVIIMFLIAINLNVKLSTRTIQVCIISIMVLGTTALYVAYLKYITGDVAITGKTGDVFFNYGGWVDRKVLRNLSIDLTIYKETEVLAYILSNPIVFMLRMFYNLADLIATLLMAVWYIVLPFFLSLIYYFCTSKKSMKAFLLSIFNLARERKVLVIIVFSVVTLPVFSLIIFYIGERFVIPSSVGVALIFALVLVYVFRESKRTLNALLLLVTIFSVYNPYDLLRAKGLGFSDSFHAEVFSMSNSYRFKQWSLPYKHAANWMKINLSYDIPVTVSAPNKGQTILGFLDVSKTTHTNGKFIPLPDEINRDSISKVFDQGVDFVVLSRNYVDSSIFKEYSKGKDLGKYRLEVCKISQAEGYIILALNGNCK